MKERWICVCVYLIIILILQLCNLPNDFIWIERTKHLAIYIKIHIYILNKFQLFMQSSGSLHISGFLEM